MSADALSSTSRAFYEQTRFKMAASIFLGSMACMALAYCSTYGGESNSAHYMTNVYKSNTDDSREKSEESLAGGYGFGAFMFFVAFAVFLSAAIYVSPVFCGSNTEKKMVSKPQEIDAGYSAYAETVPPSMGQPRPSAPSTNTSVSDKV